MAGLGQAFSPLNVRTLKAAVQDAASRYVIQRCGYEARVAAEAASEKGSPLEVRHIREEGVYWLIELFLRYLPASATHMVDATGASPEQLFDHRGVYRAVDEEDARRHPLLQSIRKVQQLTATDDGEASGIARSLTEQELSLVGLPVEADSVLATFGLEKATRKASDAAQGSDVVDLLDWSAIAAMTHFFFTAEPCRTRWLMMERPSITSLLWSGVSAEEGPTLRTVPLADEPRNDARARRRLRWAGPGPQEWSKEESAALEKAVAQVRAAGHAPHTGHFWDEVKLHLQVSDARCPLPRACIAD